MRGAFAAGASGYLLWHVTKEARDQYAIVLVRVIRCSTSSPTSLTGSAEQLLTAACLGQSCSEPEQMQEAFPDSFRWRT
jgi:hypothetical protein